MIERFRADRHDQFLHETCDAIVHAADDDRLPVVRSLASVSIAMLVRFCGREDARAVLREECLDAGLGPAFAEPRAAEPPPKGAAALSGSGACRWALPAFIGFAVGLLLAMSFS